MVRSSPGIRAAVLCYDLLWSAAIPILSMNPRLSDGIAQRRGIELPPPCLLWIQAASVGEAYLAREIVKRLVPPAAPLGVLLTTNTRQGLAIHEETLRLPEVAAGPLRAVAAYFPFDAPRIMRRVVGRVRPAVAVLLETEIWPGFLRELRNQGTRVLLLNGRLSPRSLARYRIWPSLWRQAAPREILAVSEADADRFRCLFGDACIGVMPNIKFDRLEGLSDSVRGAGPPIFGSEPPGSPFVVLGSVRKEEEGDATRIIKALRAEVPGVVIGLFPRHLHRVATWRKRLDRMGIPVILRSGMGCKGEALAPAGTVILWDTVGELAAAYAHAQTAFVGGSLAPLGGQNFLEALICGVIPVIGPSWEDFRWVGTALFESGLARIGEDWRAVAAHLIRDLKDPPSRDEVKARGRAYFSGRRGGAAAACRHIASCLSAGSRAIGSMGLPSITGSERVILDKDER